VTVIHGVQTFGSPPFINHLIWDADSQNTGWLEKDQTYFLDRTLIFDLIRITFPSDNKRSVLSDLSLKRNHLNFSLIRKQTVKMVTLASYCLLRILMASVYGSFMGTIGMHCTAVHLCFD